MSKKNINSHINKFSKKVVRFFKKTIKLFVIIGGDAYASFKKMPSQFQILSLLVLVLIIGVSGVIYVVNSDNDVVVRVEDYSPSPEREILYTCTDTEMDPAKETINGGEFIRFRFKNDGTNPTSFSVSGEETQVGSTIAIAPGTIASFSWRVPPKIKDKELTPACTQGDKRLQGEIKFIEKKK